MRIWDCLGQDRHRPSFFASIKKRLDLFSLHETIVYDGTETYLWYKHHLEAVYCISGEGEIEDLQSGTVHPIRGGTMYALNKHEKHKLRAKTDLQMICVFNPPITGNEIHTKEGYYSIDTES